MYFFLISFYIKIRSRKIKISHIHFQFINLYKGEIFFQVTVVDFPVIFKSYQYYTTNSKTTILLS